MLGLMNNRLHFERRVSTRDAAGQMTDTWVLAFSAWADIRFLSGIETVKASTEVAISRGSIRIYRSSGQVTEDMRARGGGRIYDIESVQPDLRGGVFVDLVFKSRAQSGG